MHYGINLISLLVNSYDEAITFFVDTLGFTLTEDTPAISGATGSTKRWVVVHPPGGGDDDDDSSSTTATTPTTGILLAQAEEEEQKSIVGKQWAGRVGLFLKVKNFEVQYQKMKNGGVKFLEEPRDEQYGRVVVFCDFWGNKWDLLEPKVSSV